MSEAQASIASAAPRGRHDLVSILLETTDLSEEQLDAARERQAESGQRLDTGCRQCHAS